MCGALCDLRMAWLPEHAKLQRGFTILHPVYILGTKMRHSPSFSWFFLEFSRALIELYIRRASHFS